MLGPFSVVLTAVGYLLIPAPPSPDAPGLDVYAFFLDHRGATIAGSAIALAGMLALAGFLVTLAPRLDARRQGPTLLMLIAGALACAASCFALAVLLALALGAEGSDPDGSRSALDLLPPAVAVAGTAFAVMLGAAAVAIERVPDRRMRRPATVALGMTPMPLLWIAPLLTDAGALGVGSVLFTVALVGVGAWVAVTALAVRPQ